MASSQTNENIERIPNNQELDKCEKMKTLLKKRQQFLCHKNIILPSAVFDDAADISDLLENDNSSQVRPHNRLHDNRQLVETLIGNIHKLKQTSVVDMDLVVEEDKNEENEVLQAISRIRKQSEKVFKKIINTQVNFNECLNNNLLANNPNHKQHIKKHEQLIKKTCEFDRGIESVIQCDQNTFGKHVKDLKIKNVNEFKNAYEDLAQGILSKVCKTGMKTSKNHEHLLSIKKYNEIPPSDELIVEFMSAVKLDPFTKQPISNPVSNKICKHVYDQTSVDQMFQNKLFISCPYIGCSNKHFTKKDLVFDMVVLNDNE